MKEWSNWSGSLTFKPTKYIEPEDEAELAEIVAKASAAGRKIKLAAAGHSSTPLVQTADTLVHLGKMNKLVHLDQQNQTATFEAGVRVHEANTALQELNYALFNTGDVDVQTLAGAISTGTHGSGRKLQNLASIMSGARMIDSKGALHNISHQHNPDIMRAMRVSLGALGIFSRITVDVVPLFKLRRLDFFTKTQTCLDYFDELAEENRNLDFYWYPRSDETKMRILNEPGKGTAKIPFATYCGKEEEGWVGEILPRKRELKFDEMEYALPREAGIKCFQTVRQRIKQKHRKHVAWRVLYRSIAKDENYMSPHYGRESVSISLHHNAGLPFEDYFSDIEPIFIEHGGRPHWAKKHNMTSKDLRRLYPEWNKFQSLRKQFDPEGFFMNDHLTKLFAHDE